jgi:ADP-L-glycero-D-manno-heptose 6-epimerase
MQVHGQGKIDYIRFPGDLKNRYQHYTQADVTGLRAAGYTAPFTTLEEGVKQTFAEEPAP